MYVGVSRADLESRVYEQQRARFGQQGEVEGPGGSKQLEGARGRR